MGGSFSTPVTGRRLLAAAFVVAAALVAARASAGATANPKFRPSWQTNGRVSAVVVDGDTIYVGGSFSAVRPPGFDGSWEPRASLAAFDARTGAVLPWNPQADGDVLALAVRQSSGDTGSLVYAGGAFSHVDGQSAHRLAVLDSVSGAPLDGFSATTNLKVKALAVTTTRLYVGGSFTSVNGVERAHLAALDPLTGSLDPDFMAQANADVRTLLAAPRRLVVGGDFTALNGSTQQQHLAVLDPASGTPLPWLKHPAYSIWDVTFSGRRLVAAEDGPGGFVLAFGASGRRLWARHADGGVQAVAQAGPGKVAVGGHFQHVCPVRRRAGTVCHKLSRQKLFSIDVVSGHITDWNPQLDSRLGVFALDSSTSALAAGGDFSHVHQQLQRGFARFRLGP